MIQQKIVITGGPGTGKSTIINKLMAMEFTCMPEISRTITREAQLSGTEQLFLEDPLLFSEHLLTGRINQYLEADRKDDEKIFFDRGLPDIYAYLDFTGRPYPEKFVNLSRQYKYSKIFMCPPWKDIYQTDNERYETFEEAEMIFRHLVNAYEELDYDMLTVPTGDIEQRLNFILNSL